MTPNPLCTLLFAGLLLSTLVPVLTSCVGRDRLYESEESYAVAVRDPVLLEPAGDGDPLRLRVVYPEAAGPFPVVVFSHGAFCDPGHYGAITDHWVSRGYVVILPHHPDASTFGPPRLDAMGNIVERRLGQMDEVIARLDEIAAAAGIPGRIDTNRLAVAGHSFGAAIAMAKAGLVMKTPDGGRQQYLDERIRGAVIMSGIGPMDDMTADDAFSGLATPLIATGGTLDVGATGRGPVHPWQWRMSPFSLAPAGDKYSVVLENGDHYLGGLICRADRGGEEDAEGATIDAALTLAFLDAYVRNDARALRFLQTADVTALTGGRARFERK